MIACGVFVPVFGKADNVFGLHLLLGYKVASGILLSLRDKGRCASERCNMAGAIKVNVLIDVLGSEHPQNSVAIPDIRHSLRSAGYSNMLILSKRLYRG